MSPIEEITNDLLVVDTEITALDARIENEENEIANSMQKAQGAFGEQQATQQVVALLQNTLHCMVLANGSLQGVKVGIHNFINNIKK